MGGKPSKGTKRDMRLKSNRRRGRGVAQRLGKYLKGAK